MRPPRSAAVASACCLSVGASIPCRSALHQPRGADHPTIVGHQLHMVQAGGDSRKLPQMAGATMVAGVEVEPARVKWPEAGLRDPEEPQLAGSGVVVPAVVVKVRLGVASDGTLLDCAQVIKAHKCIGTKSSARSSIPRLVRVWVRVGSGACPEVIKPIMITVSRGVRSPGSHHPRPSPAHGRARQAAPPGPWNGAPHRKPGPHVQYARFDR